MTIPTYFLVISVALCIALFWVVRRAEQLYFSREITLDLSLIIMVVGFLGSRLFHVLYESPTYYQQNWLRIFEVWNGGFVFYGGAVPATLLAIYWTAKKNQGLYQGYLDLFAPIGSFMYISGRVACFLAGCCYGKHCDLPWAINGLHPTQLYAVFWELGTLVILLICERIPPNKRRPAFLGKSGCIFYLWMALHSLGRLIMELYRDDDRGPQWGLSISSWISLIIFVLGIYFVVRKTPRPTNWMCANWLQPCNKSTPSPWPSAIYLI